MANPMLAQAVRNRTYAKRLLAACVGALLVAVFLAQPHDVRTATSAGPALPRPPVARHGLTGFPRTFQIFTTRVHGRDLIVTYPTHDIAYERRINPHAIILMAPKGPYRKGFSWTYGGGANRWRKPIFDTIRDGRAAMLGTIPPFDKYWDIMHRPDGSVARLPRFGSFGFNLADLAHKGTPEKIAKMAVYAAKYDGLYRRGFDGVWSDNVVFGFADPTSLEGRYQAGNIDSNRDGKADNLELLGRSYDTGLAYLAATIRADLPGKYVGGNGIAGPHSDYYLGQPPDGWLRAGNVTLFENLDRYADRSGEVIARARRWLAYRDPYGMPRLAATVQRALDSSGKPFELPQGDDQNQPRYMLDPAVLKSMRWGLTLSMVAGLYYEIYLGSHATDWWYDEYDGGAGIRQRGYLGFAKGPAVELRHALWRRDFDHGIVVNNSSLRAQTVKLGGTFKKLQGPQNPSLNNGAVVSSVTVPPRDGIILLRTS